MRSNWVWAMSLAALCGSAAVSPTAHAQQLPVAYKIIDLGTLGGDYSFGRSLNEANQVVGGSYISPSSLEVHPFLYDPSTGTMTDLGVLAGKPYAYATGINNAGEVAGTVYNDTFGTPYRAFLYSNQTMIDLGVVSGSSSTSAATCINDAGHVLGGLQPGTNHSFIYKDRTMVDLSPALNVSVGRVNNAGEFTGLRHVTSGGDFHAILYSDGAVTDLGTLGGTYSEGMDINAAAHVTGWSYLPDWNAHAFLYRNGVMSDLGTLPGAQESEAMGLNDLDQAVGDSDGRAVIFSNGQIADLTNMIETTSPLRPYVTLTQAWDINDHGWIVVDGRDSRFPSGSGIPFKKRTHAYLLQPVWP